jgi:hypothetical protein
MNKSVEDFSSIKLVNKEKLIFLMDLDGTIVSEDIHYNIYRDILIKYNINFSKEEFIESTNNEKYNGRCTNYLFQNGIINKEEAEKISNLKKELTLTYTSPIHLIPNCEIFLKKILNLTDNIVIVTNSSKKYVDFLKEKFTILKRIKYWISRENYTNPKPDPEPYITALKIFNITNNINEYTIIGFENSNLGLKSILHLTNNIFCCCYDYSISYNNDNITYFNNYNHIIEILNI